MSDLEQVPNHEAENAESNSFSVLIPAPVYAYQLRPILPKMIDSW